MAIGGESMMDVGLFTVFCAVGAVMIMGLMIMGLMIALSLTSFRLGEEHDNCIILTEQLAQADRELAAVRRQLAEKEWGR